MQNTTSIKNLPQVSEQRCKNVINSYGDICNKWLMIVDGKEVCINCDTFVGQETREIELNMRKQVELRKQLKSLEVFKSESLVNDRLKQASFENYEPINKVLSDAKETMKRFVNKFPMEPALSVILIGTYGLGKSHLAYATVKELAKKQKSTLFISVPKLLTKIRASYNENSSKTEEKIMDALETVDCLVLDDIGAEQTKLSANGEVSWLTQKLFEIIDSRIGKHTIFTTNLDYGGLQKHLGPRNFSRLMEGIHVIKMEGEDYRLRRFKK